MYEMSAISLIATVGGFTVPAAMGAKLLADLWRAWIRSHDEKADFLELTVNGKDYSLELESITNGGSEKIHNALRELERCA